MLVRKNAEEQNLETDRQMVALDTGMKRGIAVRATGGMDGGNNGSYGYGSI